MRFKKIWNNRIFRTFVQTVLGTIFSYFAVNNIMDTDSKVLFGLLISAFSTALAKIMPLLDEEEK